MKLTENQIQFIIDGLNNSNTTLEGIGHWLSNDVVEKCGDSYLINERPCSKEELIQWLKDSDEVSDCIFELVTLIRTKI